MHSYTGVSQRNSNLHPHPPPPTTTAPPPCSPPNRMKSKMHHSKKLLIQFDDSYSVVANPIAASIGMGSCLIFQEIHYENKYSKSHTTRIETIRVPIKSN